MKKIILVITVSILTAFCGSTSKKEVIQGKWVLEDINSKANGEEDEKMKEFADAMKKALIGKLSFDFKADNTFENVGPRGKTMTGTWIISEDKKTLTTEDKEKKNFEIVSLDSNKLVISPKGEDGIGVLTFKRAD